MLLILRASSAMKLKLIMLVCLGAAISYWFDVSHASSNVTGMVLDYCSHKNWKQIVVVDGENKDVLSPADIRRVVYSLKGSSVMGVVKSQERISKNASSMPLNLNPPIYQIQFLCSFGPTLVDYMKKAGEGNYFTGQQQWFVTMPQNITMEDIKISLSKVSFYIDSEVVLALPTADSEEKWELLEVWRVGPGSDIFHQVIGEWSGLGGLRLHRLPHKYDRRKDMRGFHLRVATIKTMPYESLTQDASFQNFKSGYVVDIWHTFQDQLNFTYTATNTLFGSLQKDGFTWNGMVGMLQTDDADVAVAPLSITQTRSLSIDFTIPIQIVSTRLYIRRPVLEATWVLYSLPFDQNLWICVPCVVVFTALCLWVLNRISILAKCDAEEISPAEALWAMFSGLVQQATSIEPRTFSSKLIFVVGFMSSLILYTCYSAILVSILTTMKPSLPFRDFEDLRQNPDWNVGVRTNTALADALALSPPGSPRRDAWKYNVLKDPVRNLPTNNDDALRNVLSGSYAFFANKEYIIYRLQKVLPLQDAVNIVDTGRDFLVRGIGFGVQKNSPFKNLLNHYLSKMTSSGHLNRLKRKWWPNISRDPDPVYPSPGFKEVFTVYLILGIGMTSSLVFLGMEYFSRNRYEDATDDDVKEFDK